ncbi:cytochrome aa3 quinol oxidase subunit IV [Fictibacillus barbaricus]|uniref:Quinol oxidase subunit 4 n=1 Tax=Fictibacillus barbaricus TaxID=182136 RepID=A0ABU1U4P3_9BACL|nr:cytochrome aa3 quinol oxidase subunit IV [Fictibacillus barbaricus]MDR7074453.1 cytochrome aa3-600 menaquinol oxidase subunit 4 [Fictibacillus barbaricus]
MANKQVVADHGGFPWKLLIGFVLSIVLTLVALWVALETGLSGKMILIVIFGFAFLQAALQLLMFMHVTENSTKNGITGRVQVGNVLFGFFVAIVIVIGSVWVMGAGHMKHDPQKDPNMKMEHGDMKMDHGKMKMDH